MITPVVVEDPPGVLGPVDDAYFRWVTDIGLTGPDKGKGGEHLFLQTKGLAFLGSSAMFHR